MEWEEQGKACACRSGDCYVPLCHCFKGNQIKAYNVASGNNMERKIINEVDGAYKREEERIKKEDKRRGRRCCFYHQNI